MSFSALEKKVLELYVTSATDPIYAVKHTILPEIFGAFGSYFSRNPKDFREHLLGAIKGQLEEEQVEVPEERLQALVTGEGLSPTEAIKRGLAKSQAFFTKWYGRYSHKSIANTVWIPMVATNVSQLFARELAYEQLAFFIEQSTRYVNFSAAGMFQDPRIMASQHRDAYTGALETLVEAYNELVTYATDYYKGQTPFAWWLTTQSEKVRNWEQERQEAKYGREIRGQALDVARFLLPQAIRTNIAWICDARSTEFDIAAWKAHPLQEMRDAAALMERHAGEIAPSLLKYTEQNDYYGEKLQDYDGALQAADSRAFVKGVDIILYDRNALDKLVAHLLQRHNRGGTWKQRYNEATKMAFPEKMAILERVTKNRGSHDEWVETDEEVDLVKLTFGIRTDIGATRDWRRHQKWDRGEALYTLDNGYHLPHMVEEMHPEAKQIFRRAMDVAHTAELAIRKDFPYQAQYVVPMATRHEIVFSGGLDQLQYMLWTRSTPEGNFSYREDAFNIAEAVVQVHPWLLGYEHYPSEKDFMTIYKERPLKNFLRLQTGKTALHQ